MRGATQGPPSWESGGGPTTNRRGVVDRRSAIGSAVAGAVGVLAGWVSAAKPKAKPVVGRSFTCTIVDDKPGGGAVVAFGYCPQHGPFVNRGYSVEPEIRCRQCGRVSIPLSGGAGVGYGYGHCHDHGPYETQFTYPLDCHPSLQIQRIELNAASIRCPVCGGCSNRGYRMVWPGGEISMLSTPYRRNGEYV